VVSVAKNLLPLTPSADVPTRLPPLVGINGYQHLTSEWRRHQGKRSPSRAAAGPIMSRAECRQREGAHRWKDGDLRRQRRFRDVSIATQRRHAHKQVLEYN
jgi:hypothetical protein